VKCSDIREAGGGGIGMIIRKSSSAGSAKTDGNIVSNSTLPNAPDDSTGDHSSKVVDKPASNEATSTEGTDAEASERVPARWGKRLLALATAIVTIGGAVAVISQTTRLLSGLTHSGPPVAVIVKSPVLGISFYQNGDRDSMSYSAPYNTTQDLTVDVSMQSEPFEVWFPELGADSSLSICVSNSSAIFTSAARIGDTSCLNRYNTAADFPFSSGTLFETSSKYIAHTSIAGDRAQSATGGDQQYYVSTLSSFPNGIDTLAVHHPHVVLMTNQHGKLYLVIYRNTDNYDTFQANNIADFVLNFG
jgi:hypothetical protein